MLTLKGGTIPTGLEPDEFLDFGGRGGVFSIGKGGFGGIPALSVTTTSFPGIGGLQNFMP